MARKRWTRPTGLKLFARQFGGQLWRASAVKVRRPFRLVFEILLGLVAVFVLTVLGSTQFNGDAAFISFEGNGRHVPTLEQLLELPSFFDITPGKPGSWYWGNLNYVKDRGSSTLGWNCALESATSSASDLEDLCEPLGFAVVPDDKDNAEQQALADDFKAFMAASVRVPSMVLDRFLSTDLMADASQVEAYFRDPAYGTTGRPRLGAVIIFQSNSAYTIRLNQTAGGFINSLQGSHPDLGNIIGGKGIYANSSIASRLVGPASRENIPHPFRGAIDQETVGSTDYSAQYINSGFLTLQNLVDSFIFKTIAGEDDITFSTSHVPIPMVNTSSSGFWDGLERVFVYAMIVIALIFSSLHVYDMVLDKESKFRDLMFVMGLSPTAFLMGWVLMAYFLTFWSALYIAAISSAIKMVDTSVGVTFVMFLFFFWGCVSHASFVAAFCNRVSTALLGNIAYSCLGAVFGTLVAGPGTSFGAQAIVSFLHPNAALVLTVSALASFERKIEGLSFSTVGTKPDNQEFSVLNGLVSLALQLVFYLFAAGYVDSILPSPMCVPRGAWHWPVTIWSKNKIFRRSYAKACKEQEEAEAEAADNLIFEPISETLVSTRKSGRGVLFANVKKTFNGVGGIVNALKGVSFTAFEGQITALLGGNGAGKSTLLSILSGAYSASSGSVSCYGVADSAGAASSRIRLGYCPQDIIVSQRLSCEEHLFLMGSIKGTDRRAIRRRAKFLLRRVRLNRFAIVPGDYLSGGSKRKLQLAMALFDASICILDEPTTGLDVTSRALVQKTIGEHREGRTILFTTHYMDEADALGDRVAIMATGNLECCGSSLYLKHHFGVGYLLTLSHRADSSAQVKDAAFEAVRSSEPETEVVSRVGAELILKLPLTASRNMSKLLAHLESNSERYALTGKPGLSASNLESVFLRILDDANARAADERAREEANRADRPVVVAPTSEAGDNELAYTKLDMVFPSMPQMVLKVIGKRFLLGRRDPGLFILSVILPIVFIIIGFALVPDNVDLFEAPPLSFSSANDDWAAADAENLIPIVSADRAELATSLGIPRLVDIPEIIPFTGPLPAFCGSPGFGFDLYNDTLFKVAEFSRSSFDFTFPTPPVTFGEDVLTNDFELAGGFRAMEEIENCLPFSAGYQFQLSEAFFAWNSSKELNQANVNAMLFVGTPLESGEGVSNVIDYTIGYNFSAVHAAPYMNNRVHSAFLSKRAGSSVDIQTTLHAFPASQKELALNRGAQFLAVAVGLGLAFGLAPVAYAVFAGREIENGAFHLQIVNGIPFQGYWCGSLVFDFVFYVMLFIPAIIFIPAFGITPLGTEIGAVLLLLVFYFFSAALFNYNIASLVGTAANAQSVSLALQIFMGPALAFVVYLFHFMDVPVNGQALFYRFIPSFSLSHALISLVSMEQLAIVIPLEEGEELSAFHPAIAGLDIAFLAITTFLYGFTLAYIHGAVKLPKLRCGSPSPEKESGMQNEDQDVSEERNYVEGLSMKELISLTSSSDEEASSQSKAILKKARKRYSNGKVAVQSLSLTLNTRECFGLLGSNGAGKSTTAKMITGEFAPTSGSIVVNGVDLVKQRALAQRSLGYCPQMDAVFGMMTGREVLRYYGFFKGVPAHHLESSIEQLMDRLTLSPFADKLVRGYSGGNKRKLGVAVSLIGSPALVLLDEPSAGVDPSSRRRISECVQELSTKTSVVLVTHSMEECEALCNRVGIMVDGGLRCLGTVQRIKSLYGKEFELEMTLKFATKAHLDEVRGVIEARGDDHRVGIAEARRFVETFSATRNKRIKLNNSSLERMLNTSEDRLVPTMAVLDWLATEQDVQDIEAYLKSRFTGVKLTDRSGLRLRFKIGQTPNMSFPEMFDLIERERDNLHLEDFALSQTTLETIFNEFAATEPDQDEAKVLENITSAKQRQRRERREKAKREEAERQRLADLEKGEADSDEEPEEDEIPSRTAAVEDASTASAKAGHKTDASASSTSSESEATPASRHSSRSSRRSSN